MGAEEEIRDYLTETADLVRKTARDPHPIRAIADAVVVSLSAGGKVLLCGNGGGAADAQHFPAGLVKRLHRDGRAPPPPPLTTAASALTPICDDPSLGRGSRRPGGGPRAPGRAAAGAPGRSRVAWGAAGAGEVSSPRLPPSPPSRATQPRRRRAPCA